MRIATLLALLACILPTACGTLSPDAGTILVVNLASFDIIDVHISECDANTWDAGRGGVDAHASRSWDVNPGCYDLRADWENDAPYLATESRGITVSPYTTYRWEVD